jgi:hypothetical protein
MKKYDGKPWNIYEKIQWNFCGILEGISFGYIFK